MAQASSSLHSINRGRSFFTDVLFLSFQKDNSTAGTTISQIMVTLLYHAPEDFGITQHMPNSTKQKPLCDHIEMAVDGQMI